MVVHACNPSYSGGRNQEDHGSKVALEGKNKFVRSYLKKPFTKIRLVERLKVKVLSSRPSTTKKTVKVIEWMGSTEIPSMQNVKRY
jgi:hypothetical protein